MAHQERQIDGNCTKLSIYLMKSTVYAKLNATLVVEGVASMNSSVSLSCGGCKGLHYSSITLPETGIYLAKL